MPLVNARADAESDQSGEIRRVVLPARDPRSGSSTTIIAAEQDTGEWLFTMPTDSHTVLLTANAVTELAGALDPDGPAAVVLALQTNAGKITFMHAPVSTGCRSPLPLAIITSLSSALGQLKAAHRLFGASKRLPRPRVIG